MLGGYPTRPLQGRATVVWPRSGLTPAATKGQYGLTLVASGGYVYARVGEAWYGPRQAGEVAHGGLVGRPGGDGYGGALVGGYSRHRTRDISPTLVVGGPLTKYTSGGGPQHPPGLVGKH